jgi:hypothetical protein
MDGMTGKEMALRAIESLPDDATIEDIMATLGFVYEVEIGIRELDAGLGVTDEEVKRRLAKWLGPLGSNCGHDACGSDPSPERGERT